MRDRRPGHDAGFTLVDLLVVIAVPASLAGIVVFAVRGTADRGQTAGCIGCCHLSARATGAQHTVLAA